MYIRMMNDSGRILYQKIYRDTEDEKEIIEDLKLMHEEAKRLGSRDKYLEITGKWLA